MCKMVMLTMILREDDVSLETVSHIGDISGEDMFFCLAGRRQVEVGWQWKRNTGREEGHTGGGEENSSACQGSCQGCAGRVSGHGEDAETAARGGPGEDGETGEGEGGEDEQGGEKQE